MSQYSTGTVTVTNGSAVVTGISTVWLTNLNIADGFSVISSGITYDVAAINSDTQLTLSTPYVGVSATTQMYTVTRDFTANLGLPYPMQGDMDTTVTVKNALQAIDTAISLNTTIGAKNQVLPGFGTGIMIPMYIYPGQVVAGVTTGVFQSTAYNSVIKLVKENPSVPFHIILNPNSGPGIVQDINYVRAIARLRGAGAYIYGYVATGYSAPVSPVNGEVDKWVSFYGLLDGIFFDEMSNTDSQVTRDEYRAYSDYAHSLGFVVTVGNSGVTVPASYFHQNVMDIMVTSEGSAYPPESTYLGDWADSYMELDKNRRVAIVYGQAALNYPSLDLIRKYNGFIYVTSAPLPSPWNSLPSYLPELVAYLSSSVTTQTALANKLDKTQKAVASGLASLDAASEVVQAQAGAAAQVAAGLGLSSKRSDGTWSKKAVWLGTDYPLQTWADTLVAGVLYDIRLLTPQNGLPIGFWYVEVLRHYGDATGTRWRVIRCTSFGSVNTPNLVYQSTCYGGTWTPFIKTVMNKPLVWTTPTFVNFWADYGGVYALKYTKDDNGTVFIRGLVKGGGDTINTAVFTLPAGYRPSTIAHCFTAATNGGQGYSELLANGVLTFYGALPHTGTATGWLSLATSFKAA